jgi:DNA-directed RNA polymerase subunit beta'
MNGIRRRADAEIDKIQRVFDRFKSLKVQDLEGDELLYREMRDRFGRYFTGGMGAAAIQKRLETFDLEAEAETLRDIVQNGKGQKKTRALKRLKVVSAFLNTRNSPMGMVLDCVPVIPPDLRPMVQLDGGRFATSDLNDLYRRVINRNNRLKRLLDLGAPEIIVNNEKRMLQEAVDALFDNGRRGRPVTGPGNRPLKSLSDMLKGKQGRFRQNLLGKRVDYSGRSVIVVGPALKLHQCGLPKKMAIELFKPFIYNKLEERGFVTTIKSAKKLVEKERPEVWDILEEVISEHPIMLNRAPTLHRLGIQAFEPVLIEGKAIQLHPLVCAAFNADFDGDQMAVHVPLSVEAQMEARVLMMSTNNILSPANGRPIINPTQDIVLGLYYATREKKFARGCYREGSLTVDKKGHAEGYLRGVYSSPEEVRMAYDNDEVTIHTGIRVRVIDPENGIRKIVNTTVGRCLIAEILPDGLSFDLVNKTLDKKALSALIDACYRKHRNKATVLLADRLRSLGFEYATRSGASICMDHMVIPKAKEVLLGKAQDEVQKVVDQYQEGLITDGERYNKIVDIWAGVADKVTQEMMVEIGKEKVVDPEGGKEYLEPSFNPIYIMADSGARGSTQQIRQLAAMRGLMAKPSGEIIETPITANFREGLSVLQYFISTHGARKGLADTALKTANSGYLTRRLVDVAQDAVIAEFDCGTLDGIRVTKLEDAGEVIQPLGDRILGRTVLEDVVDPLTGEVLVPLNTELDEALVMKIEDAGIEEVLIRSVLTCSTRRGVCAKCYGRDLARGYKVNIGEAIGIIASQSIGEPGTQLTMRTFHIGGAAARGKIEQSSLEARTEGYVRIRGANLATQKDGMVVVMNRHGEIVIVDDTGREREHHRLVYGAVLKVTEGEKIKAGQMLAEWDAFAMPILSEVAGIVKFGDIVEGVTMVEKLDEVTGLSRKVIIESRAADLRPRISMKSKTTGDTLKLPNSTLDARYLLPVGANIVVQDGDEIEAGEVIAKMPRETTKTQDITGGLPRVAELFEARKPKDHAIIAEIDGEVSFGKDTKGKRKVLITPFDPQGKILPDHAREYLIAKGKHIQVQPGDRMRAGEPLMDGPANPHDILRVKGEKELAAYLVNEIQQVYRLQGVVINDKHIEVIVRQMMRRVRIKDVGDTNFLIDEQIEKHLFEKENQRVIEKGGKPAIAEPLLLGITKASLSTESFISASSFQETTKVLTEAAICGKTDTLRGLKENVIMGRLIPAGTGLPAYKVLKVVVEGEDEGRGYHHIPREPESLTAVNEE